LIVICARRLRSIAEYARLLLIDQHRRRSCGDHRVRSSAIRPVDLSRSGVDPDELRSRAR
jgi:hypothetical protein